MTTAAPTYDLGTLHGGLRLPGSQVGVDRELPIQDLTIPVPKQLVLPIAPARRRARRSRSWVSASTVLKGQLIADPEPVRGRRARARFVIRQDRRHRAVARYAQTTTARPAPCIVIEMRRRRPRNRGVPRTPLRLPRTRSPRDVLAQMHPAGRHCRPRRRRIPDGTETPSSQRPARSITCFLNGVECEPYISCDDMLMRERAKRSRWRRTDTDARARSSMSSYIVVESDKPEAVQGTRGCRTRARSEDKRIVLKQVPTIYPSGGEDQLVQLVTKQRGTEWRSCRLT